MTQHFALAKRVKIVDRCGALLPLFGHGQIAANRDLGRVRTQAFVSLPPIRANGEACDAQGAWSRGDEPLRFRVGVEENDVPAGRIEYRLFVHIDDVRSDVALEAKDVPLDCVRYRHVLRSVVAMVLF